MIHNYLELNKTSASVYKNYLKIWGYHLGLGNTF
jgi:hypothetical protein